MTPDELVEQLKSGAKAQKRRNLEIIHGICREQHERGSRDFSIATVGHLSEQRGGPIIQAIRNKKGEHFRALILAWASHTGGIVKRIPKVIDNPMQAVLAKIEDPAVRSVMGSVLAENVKLKGQMSILRRQTDIIIDKRPVNSLQNMEILSPSVKLTPGEIEALTHAISEDLMRTEGWTAEENGRVRNAKGRTLYKPGYVTAIKKVMERGEDNG